MNYFYFFKNDDTYNLRIAALSEYLLDNCDFSDTSKHAISFVRNLTTKAFRSIYSWNLSEGSNTRHHKGPKGKNISTEEELDSEEMGKSRLELPIEFRTYVNQERTRHLPYFDLNNPTPVDFKMPVWIASFKRQFFLAKGEAYSKAVVVS